MTEEGDVTSEQEMELFSFQHKLIHEYVAAHYVSKQIATNPEFLSENFRSTDDIFTHIELIGFCTDIVKNNSSSLNLFIEHITRKYSDIIFRQQQQFGFDYNFMYQFRAVLSAMMPAFGKHECDFARLCKAYIHTGAYNNHYCVYAVSNEKRVLILSMASVNDFFAALSFYSDVTNLHMDEFGKEGKYTEPLPIPTIDENIDFRELARRHNIRSITMKNPHQIYPEIAMFVYQCQNMNMYRFLMDYLPHTLHSFHLLSDLKELNLSGKDISNLLYLLTEHTQTTLVKLNVSHCNLTRADIEALAVGIEAGRFPKLQEVDVMGYDLSQSLHLLYQIPGLKELDVSGKDISNSLHLLTEHAQTSLVKLNVSRCKLKRSDIEALGSAIEAGIFPKLQDVDATGNDLSNSLHLLTKHVQTGLVKLNVSRCNLTRADIEALAEAIEAGRFPKLQAVGIMDNDLSKSLHLVHLLPGLQELNISWKDISNSLHLLTDHVQTSLVKLNVSQCNLKSTDIEALGTAVEAGIFPKLQDVNVTGNDLSNSLHLLTKHVQTSLVKLIMRRCYLVSADISALAAALTAGRLPRLEWIDLGGNDLDDDSVQPLCKSLHVVHQIHGVEELDVSGKDISNSLHLLTEHVQTNLVKLNVSRCNLTSADIDALAIAIEAGRFPKLQDVNVMGNILSQSLHLIHLLPGLKELDVSKTNISNSLHLLTEHVQTSLVTLNVSYCNLTRADIEALASATGEGRFPKLHTVFVVGNDLSQSRDLIQLVPGVIEKMDKGNIKQYLPQSLYFVHLLPSLEELHVSEKDISNSLHLLTKHVQTSLARLTMRQCNLTAGDISALAAALTAGRLPRLKMINLAGNDLSNALHLLTEHVQTSLFELTMCQCNLVAADISALAAALTAGRLPYLQDMELQYNNLDDDSVQPLCEALLQYEGPDQSVQGISYGKRKLVVWLWGNNLSAEFVEQWEKEKRLTHKDNVSVHWPW